MIKRCIFAIIFRMLFYVAVFAQNAPDDSSKWYVPELARLQYAGNTGMFSAGASWSFCKNYAELSSSFGYAPAFAAGRDIYIPSLKCLFVPRLCFNFNKTFSFKPFAIGAVFSYTFKDKINNGQATENYPDVYYGKNICWRIGVLCQTELYAKLKSQHISGVGIYLEASWWDVYLVSKFDHCNGSYLSIWDITTFGLGTKVYF